MIHNVDFLVDALQSSNKLNTPTGKMRSSQQLEIGRTLNP
jgi:hypothetical protein